MGVLVEVWGRATTTQPLPATWTVVGLGLLALLVVASSAGYRVVRHVVTLVHEAGHALVAVLCGRRLAGIRLHADTSGLTVSHGRTRGLGMVATLVAGYPAPALLALAATVPLTRGYAVGLLWLGVLACTLMLLQVRNLYGLWVVLVAGLAVGGASWLLPAAALSLLAHLAVWALLLAAPRSVFELSRARRRGRERRSDADQLAALTPVPAAAWTAAFGLVTTACLVAGTALLTGWA